MERKKVKVSSEKPRWRKITPGKIYPFPNKRNRRVKPGEIIEATEEEIANVKEHFELVSPGPKGPKVITLPKATKPAKPAKPAKKVEADVYNVVPTGDDMFDVVSSSGKTMNNLPLPKEAAEELQNSLETETVEK